MKSFESCFIQMLLLLILEMKLILDNIRITNTGPAQLAKPIPKIVPLSHIQIGNIQLIWKTCLFPCNAVVSMSESSLLKAFKPFSTFTKAVKCSTFQGFKIFVGSFFLFKYQLRQHSSVILQKYNETVFNLLDSHLREIPYCLSIFKQISKLSKQIQKMFSGHMSSNFFFSNCEVILFVQMILSDQILLQTLYEYNYEMCWTYLKI